jgi:integrase
MTWARQQGYIDENPIRDLEVPGATAREVFISGEEFERACGLIRDRDFLELCRVTFEVGCRPQEILRIEARHCDFKNSRWVLPPSEAKGKRKPRIIYLTPRALDISLRLAEKYPTGRLFRNSKDKPWTMASVNCGFSRLRARMGRHAIMEQGLDIQELMAAELRLTRPELKGPKDLSQSERNKLRNTVAARHATRLSLYALRHSWATNALQSGLDSLTVAVLMGHSDPSTLARVYQHLSLNPRHLLDEAHKVRHD